MQFWNTENIHTIIDDKFKPILENHLPRLCDLSIQINQTNVEKEKRALCLQHLALIQHNNELLRLRQFLHAYASLPMEYWRTRKPQPASGYVDPSVVRSFLSLLRLETLKLQYKKTRTEPHMTIRTNKNGGKDCTNILEDTTDNVFEITQKLIERYQHDTAAKPYFKPNPTLTLLDWVTSFVYACCLLAAIFVIVILGFNTMPFWSVPLVAVTTGLLGYAFAGLYSNSNERYKAIYAIIDDPSSTKRSIPEGYYNESLKETLPTQEELDKAFAAYCDNAAKLMS